jgi:hypothetical protein
MQILTLTGCGTARMEFDRKFFKGGESKGPATKPFLIQLAIESVTSTPWGYCIPGVFYSARAKFSFLERRGAMFKVRNTFFCPSVFSVGKIMF